MYLTYQVETRGGSKLASAMQVVGQVLEFPVKNWILTNKREWGGEGKGVKEKWEE